MKRELLLTICVTLVCGLSSCSGGEGGQATGVFVFQSDSEFALVSESQEIELSKNYFAIRFINMRYDDDNSDKWHACRIAAFRNPEAFEYANVGGQISDIQYFFPGTGMAPYESGRYECLILDEEAHHYLIYGEDGGSQRLQFVSENDGVLKLEFRIDKICNGEETIQLRSFNYDALYLAILIDRNMNGVVDHGELTKLTIRFR